MHYSTLVLSLFFCLQGSSQDYFYNNRYYDSEVLLEAGISAGAMNCFTDLGGHRGAGTHFIKDMNVGNTRPYGGFYIALLYRHKLAVRLEASFGQVKAYDSTLKNDNSIAKYRYDRNLHFKSSIAELALMVEVHPLIFVIERTQENKFLSPYVLAGTGLFHFNPKGRINSRWVELQPLHTEGQGFKEYPDRVNYKLWQINFPVGIGIKYEVSAIWNLRMEIVHRFLQTDYLDDASTRYIDPKLFSYYFDAPTASLAASVADRRRTINALLPTYSGSIRGNPGNKDSYFTLAFKAALTLNRQKR